MKQQFKPGQKVFSQGLSLKGKKTIETCVFIEYRKADEYGQDCVSKTSFKMRCQSDSLYETRQEAKAALK